MSIQAISWVLGPVADTHPDLDATARLVLLCYANYADEYAVAFPGRTTVAHQCGCSVDTVDRRMAELQLRGLLDKVPDDLLPSRWHTMQGNRRPVAYRLALGPQTAAPSGTQGPQTTPYRGRTGAAAVRHKPKNQEINLRAPAREAATSPTTAYVEARKQLAARSSA